MCKCGHEFTRVYIETFFRSCKLLKLLKVGNFEDKRDYHIRCDWNCCYFVILPLVKIFLQALLAFLGNVIGAAIGVAILVGAIALCIMCPVLLVPATIFVFYSLSKGKAGN